MYKYEMRLTLTKWAYENCVGAKAPNGFVPWGYAIVETEKCATVYRTIMGDKVNETEKAICIEYNAELTDSRCNVTKVIKWRNWIPKSQIIADKAVKYFDGGMSELVDVFVNGYLTGENKKEVKGWY